MKNLLVINFLFIFSLMQAQTTEIKIVTDTVTTPGTTLYQLQTSQKNESGNVYSITLEPTDGGLPATEFVTWFYNKTRGVAGQEFQHKAIRRELMNTKQTYAALLDTLSGAGTYQTAVNNETLQGLQGTWILVRRPPDAKPTKKVVAVSGNTLTTGNKTGTITVTDEDSFTLSGYVAADLKFVRRLNGTWIAKRGETVFILRTKK